MNYIINVKVTILVLLIAGFSFSFAQNEKSLKDMPREEYDKYQKASEDALKEVSEFAKMAEKLRVFRQTNDLAYGFPSDVEKLKDMQKAADSFAENDLKEIEEFYKSLQKKYNANDANSLNTALEKVINPFPQSKKSYQWPANALEQNIAWFNEFRPELDKALKEVEEQAENDAEKNNKAKQLVDFPEDNYDGSGLSEIKEQMLKALMGNVIKSADEVTAIAVISDWKKGVYLDSKQPYRKINGAVLFADTDDDGISRFTSFVFIANKVNGDWKPLKFKAFCNGCPEGWAKAGSGSMTASGGGFLSSLLWFILAFSNILAGLIAGRGILKKSVPAIEKITSLLEPYAIQIGLTALIAGLLSFTLSILGLRLFYVIIPQATAAILGFLLAYDYIKSNAKGKLKEQIDHSQDSIAKVNAYTQTIGLAGLVVGILYLLLNGSLYFI
jgi:hypothetical protein